MKAKNNFKQYMEAKGFKEKSIETYLREHNRFKSWLITQGIHEHQVSYNDLLELIRYWKDQGRSVNEIVKGIGVVRKYYRHLIEENQVEDNPADGLFIKRTNRRIPHDLIEREDLVQFYVSYPVTDAYSQRNRTLLGLLVYQALTIEDFEKLEAHHLKLREGKIQVPGSPRSNGRTLQLEASQILELQEYQLVTRAQLLDDLKKVKWRKVPGQIDQLFFGTHGDLDLNGLIREISLKLRKMYPGHGLITATKIRQSVITWWLKTKDVRIVQYMSGHKHASSTERYNQVNLEDLKQKLIKYHPMK